MELRDLMIFDKVAAAGGVTRASAELNMVQSNVTARIKALEHSVGTQLFVRKRTGMELTDRGRLLLPYVSRISDLVREARSVMRDEAGDPTGELRLGSMETTMASRLPKVLVDYRREAPRVDLNLVTGPTRELIDMVRRRRLDCALVAGPVDDPFLRSEKVIGEELVVVMAERWASMEDYYRSVGNPTVLVFREGCSYRERFLSVLARRGWSSFTRMEFGTLDGIMGCVESDIGITMVPLAVAEMAVERHGVRIHHLSQVESVIDTMLIWRADAFETRAFGIFRGALTGIFPRPS